MLSHSFTRHASVGAALLCAAALGAAWAQEPESDPPARAARLSFAQGDVSLQPAGVEDWTAAVVNRPLTTGDKLWTDENARAEVELGADSVRLAPTTGFSLLTLDDRTLQMQVTAGTLEVSVQELGPDENIEIDTPNLALTVQRTGNYRVEVNDSGGATIVKVMSGEAEITGSGQTFQVHAQEQATFTDTGGLTADVGRLGAPDDFDQWWLERDRRDQQAHESDASYVSPDMTGSEDLDEYGTWQSVPDYGTVWVPTAIPVGWAPYHFGHWVWVSPWGWTWVDDAPWGFAPFHYGRWAYASGSWCWVPGPRHVHPVYAPALVAWVGGPHFNVAVAGGAVGPGVAWFPLAPREVYVPAYHVSPTYVRNVNVTNTTIVNNIYITNAINNSGNVRYANRGAPGAVTAVPHSVFTSAQSVGTHAVRLNAGQLAGVEAAASAPAIVPARASVLGGGAARGLRARVPPGAIQSRAIVVQRPPAPVPVSFDRQRDAIQANGGRPLAPTQMTQLAPHPAPRAIRPAGQLPGRGVHLEPPETGRTGSASGNAPPALRTAPRGLPPEQPAFAAPPPDRALRSDRPPGAQEREPRPEGTAVPPREQSFTPPPPREQSFTPPPRREDRPPPHPYSPPVAPRPAPEPAAREALPHPSAQAPPPAAPPPPASPPPRVPAHENHPSPSREERAAPANEHPSSGPRDRNRD